MKKILLVNPWIYDFAAYDLWMKPWGLLKISSILKDNGFQVDFIDCLDRHHSSIPDTVNDHNDGTGKFISEEVEKPDVLKDVPRKFKRYGLPVEIFKKEIEKYSPDIVFVSSCMTYWYPGAFKAVEILKKYYPGTQIILGGVYATLCSDHAAGKSGADHVVKNTDLDKLSAILGKEMDFSFRNVLDSEIDYSFYAKAPYGILRLSLGCPFDCNYCAQKKLGPSFMKKKLKAALEEIEKLYGRGIRKFAFYDDALFFDNEYIVKFLSRIVSSGMECEFYTPNGLHARYLTEEIASLLKKTNFVNPILSLEIADNEKGEAWHSKVSREDLERAVSFLRSSGYKRGEYMVYLMLGAPGTDLKDIRESIDFVHSLGAKISLSEFSPISGTVLSEGFDGISEEPLLQNNSAFPLFNISEWDAVQDVKKTARKLNQTLISK